MELLLGIRYCLIIGNESPLDSIGFGGFHLDVVGYHHVFAHIASLPCHVMEIGEPTHRVNSIRISGAAFWCVSVLEVTYLDELSKTLALAPILVLISTARTYDLTAQFVANLGHPVLHVHIEETPDSLSYRQLSVGMLSDHLNDVANFMSREEAPNYPIALEILGQRIAKQKQVTPVKRRTPSLRGYGHAATLPNEVVLRALGFRLRRGQILSAPNDRPYVNAIAHQVRKISSARESLRPKGQSRVGDTHVELLLVAPAMQKHFYRARNWKFADGKCRSAVRRLSILLRKQTSYGFSVDDPRDIHEIFHSPTASSLLNLRTEEIHLVSALASLRSAQDLIPAIRLPYRINSCSEAMLRLRGCLTGAKLYKKRRKAPQLVEQLQKALRDAVPDKLYDHIREARGVKVMSDAPLELLPIGDLPLMLHAEISRIPVTPGNLFVQHAIGGPQIPVPSEVFKKILVIRSFKEGDRLKNVLKMAFSEYLKGCPGGSHEVNIEDVKSREDFISALKNSDAHILIYDGHGSHLSDDIGRLSIDDGLDVWGLQGKVNVPPIVILSACDTHPLGGSHATTASGFLTLGARTVLGTNLPVEGFQAGRFAARLVYRIIAYLPAILTHSPMIRWSQVVTGLLRMSYITDILEAALSQGQIGESDYLFLSASANERIGLFQSDWYTSFLQEFSASMSQPIDSTKRMIKKLGLTETLRYVQLGNPENIIIGPPTGSMLEKQIRTVFRAAEARLLANQSKAATTPPGSAKP